MMTQRFKSMIDYLNSMPSPSGFIHDLTSTSVESSRWMKSRPLLLGEYLTIWSSICISSVNDSTSPSILCGVAKMANRDALEQSATNNTEQFDCIDFERSITLSSNVSTDDEIIEHMSKRKLEKITIQNAFELDFERITYEHIQNWMPFAADDRIWHQNDDWTIVVDWARRHSSHSNALLVVIAQILCWLPHRCFQWTGTIPFALTTMSRNNPNGLTHSRAMMDSVNLLNWKIRWFLMKFTWKTWINSINLHFGRWYWFQNHAVSLGLCMCFDRRVYFEAVDWIWALVADSASYPIQCQTNFLHCSVHRQKHGIWFLDFRTVF